MDFENDSLWGALVLYLRLEQKNQLVMVRLGRDVLEVCGVSQSTMMKQAMENTIKINPPVVMPVDTNGRFPYFILSNREGRMEKWSDYHHISGNVRTIKENGRYGFLCDPS